MNKRSFGMTFRLILIILCFSMAILSFLGFGTMDEPNGRVIFGLLWIAVGSLAVLRYSMEKRKRQVHEENDEDGSERS